MANTITVAKTSHNQKRNAEDYEAGTILRSTEGSFWMVVTKGGIGKGLVKLSDGFLSTTNPFVYGEVLTTGAEVTLKVGE
jgi:hypothetical protein